MKAFKVEKNEGLLIWSDADHVLYDPDPLAQAAMWAVIEAHCPGHRFNNSEELYAALCRIEIPIALYAGLCGMQPPSDDSGVHVIGVREGTTMLLNIGGLLGSDLRVNVTGLSIEEIQAKAAEMFAMYREQLKGMTPQLFPGVLQSFRSYHEQGAIIIVCSNKPEDVLTAWLENCGLAEFVHHIRGYREGALKKPDPGLWPDLLGMLAQRTDLDIAGITKLAGFGDSAADSKFHNEFHLRDEWETSFCRVAVCVDEEHPHTPDTELRCWEKQGGQVICFLGNTGGDERT